MISPQKAVEAAVRYMVEVIGEVEQPEHFTVEKISISADKKIWTIVLGYERKGTEANSLSVLLGNNPRRYKIMDIDAETGEGLSFETYQPNKN